MEFWPAYVECWEMGGHVSARTVVAGLPHHVTQRGNRREAIFFEDGDQEVYRDLLAEQTRKALLYAQFCER
jgi:REP element-mobilizing transposase RayT